MTEIGERVREMQDRVGKLMLVIVYRVTASLEGELNETTFPNDFRKDIDNLKGHVFIPTFALAVLCIRTGLWNFFTKA